MKDFKNIINAHKGIIFKVAKAYSKGTYDFDDLFQEIAIQIWRSLPNFKNNSKLSTYIYRIALNTGINFKKKNSKNIIEPSEYRCADFSTNCPETTDEIDLLYKAIQLLPKDEKAIILLYLDQYSHKEIANIIGISSNYIGVKVNRIKNKLLQIIKTKNK